MKCPLNIRHNTLLTSLMACLENDCAWWVGERKECVIQTIASHLSLISVNTGSK